MAQCVSRSKINKGESIATGLVGVWRLIEYSVKDSLGLKVYTYGNAPRGYFIYDSGGFMSINVMRTPPPSKLEIDHATAEQLRERISAGFSYFGRYTVHDDSTVIHHVEGGTIINYIGTDQFRRYRRNADTLWIGSSGNQCCTLILVK